MLTILRALAGVYEKSAHKRAGSTKDYTIDYEKFLRDSNVADGDEREIAERGLRKAELQSNGLLRVDRHPKSGIPERLRLSASGGEAWLFQQVGETPPVELRTQLAEAFRDMSTIRVPDRWQHSWSEWLCRLSRSALDGGSVSPFSRTDLMGNEALVNVICGVLLWRGPSLIRYASTAICGDSKQLQRLEPRLRPALTMITGSDSLEDFGILRKPRAVTFHGPLRIAIGGNQTDFSVFAGPLSLSETNLTPDCLLTTSAPLCLTVENEDTFHELASTNPGVLLVLTSYAGSAVRRLLNLLPERLPILHFGDGDPAGSDIVRDLRVKTRRDIQPLLIPGTTSTDRRPLVQSQIRILKRLNDSDLPASMRVHVEGILESGMPMDFEQESIPINSVWEAVATFEKYQE